MVNCCILLEFCVYDDTACSPENPRFEVYEDDKHLHNKSDLAWPYKRLREAYMVRINKYIVSLLSTHFKFM